MRVCGKFETLLTHSLCGCPGYRRKSLENTDGNGYEAIAVRLQARAEPVPQRRSAEVERELERQRQLEVGRAVLR